jgi:hypothetical protein
LHSSTSKLYISLCHTFNLSFTGLDKPAGSIPVALIFLRLWYQH